jgi:hypothetical protein
MTIARAWATALAISCLGAGCHPKQDPGGAPAPAVDKAAAKSPLLGDWCMQSQALSPTGERTADGSKWTFNDDGTYDYMHKWHRQHGTWKLDAKSLEISEVGAHEVIELGADRMVLKRGVYQFFGRDCGPEYAKAQQVSELVTAAGDGALDKVTEKLNAGADINGEDQLGILPQTALMAATRDRHAPVVELLLQRGARVDRVSGAGDTAMMIAERLGHQDIIALLERFGARPTPREIKQDPEPERQRAASADEPAQRTTQSSTTVQSSAINKQKVPTTVEEMRLGICDERKKSIQKALAGELDSTVNMLGVTREEYAARQQELWNAECR